MHGVVFQMLVFILNNYGGFSIVFCVVTVLFEYLTDCSIRVSRSCLNFFSCFFFFGGGGGGGGGEACAPRAPLDPPLHFE